MRVRQPPGGAASLTKGCRQAARSVDPVDGALAVAVLVVAGRAIPLVGQRVPVLAHHKLGLRGLHVVLHVAAVEALHKVQPAGAAGTGDRGPGCGLGRRPRHGPVGRGWKRLSQIGLLASWRRARRVREGLCRAEGRATCRLDCGQVDPNKLVGRHSKPASQPAS